ncbi:MAG: zinc-dependent peptidase [Chitinophagaceae bacterium]|nr:zinc-dependent peptidase [Chitinophagaceae bacterium]
MIDAIMITAGTLAVLLLLFISLIRKGKKNRIVLPMPENYRELLNRHVLFYQKLDEQGRKHFEDRVQYFLSGVRITGVNTAVEDLDRVLIGASAIIPIYAFPDWEYVNLNEVLLYPETFSEEFEQEGSRRSVLGMVGSGAMQNVMILSRHALRQGFSNKTDKNNTAIHEFVHLIDKTDGDVDGVPDVLLSNQYTLPWLDMMHKKIREIMKNRSDIDPYGATNQAEFFAVVSEYFFERPDLLRSKHPELYGILNKMFSRSSEETGTAV